MNFCPEWLYDLAVARVAQEFLSSSMPIYSFAQKYSKGLSETYEQVTPAELSDPAEEILRFMAKVGISDTSDEVLQNYIFFKLNFEKAGQPRKMKSMFGTIESPVKAKDYAPEKVLKDFMVYVYGMRSDAIPTAPMGWRLEDDKHLEGFKKVMEKSASILDSL